MRTTLRKIGNSRGVLIPSALLAESGIGNDIELHLEGTRIVIEPARPARVGWFDGYRAEEDDGVWDDLPPASDSGEWEW